MDGLAVKDSLLTPDPANSTTSVGFDALLENLTVPPDHPVAAGVNLTLRSTLCPASKTSGRLNVDVAKSELLAVISESVTLVCPLFVKVTSKLSVWPTSMAPNRRLGGEHVSCGTVAPTLAGVMPSSRAAIPMVKKWTV